jgi:hypothetical protein
MNWIEYQPGRLVEAGSVNHIFTDDNGRIRFDSSTTAKGVVDTELEAAFLRALELTKSNDKIKPMKWNR